jgi:hypothetical protein
MALVKAPFLKETVPCSMRLSAERDGASTGPGPLPSAWVWEVEHAAGPPKQRLNKKGR